MKTSYVLGGVMSVMLVTAPGHAQDMDDTKLQTEAQRIDKDQAAGTDAQKTDSLAKQFNVPESTVQNLRSQGQGWGEVTIGLSMAQKLAATDSKTYPTIGDALTKVESLRASHEGWGKIAKDLGFKLGPVVSAAHHAHHEMVETVHPEKAEHGHMEKMEHHPEHPEHIEHLEHPEHPDRPERPGH
jgi:hypothetical protein